MKKYIIDNSQLKKAVFFSVFCIILSLNILSQTRYRAGAYKSERDAQLQELDYSGANLILSGAKTFELEYHDMATTTKIKGKWYIKKDTLYLVPKQSADVKNKKTPSIIPMFESDNYICPVKHTYIRCVKLQK